MRNSSAKKLDNISSTKVRDKKAQVIKFKQQKINPEDSLSIFLGEKELLTFNKNGDILVKGELMLNDIEVVYGIREWMKQNRIEG